MLLQSGERAFRFAGRAAGNQPRYGPTRWLAVCATIQVGGSEAARPCPDLGRPARSCSGERVVCLPGPVFLPVLPARPRAFLRLSFSLSVSVSLFSCLVCRRLSPVLDRLRRASCSSAQAELPVVRLQDPSSKGETSNPIEEVRIARLITVQSTTMRERDTHTHTHKQTDGQTDRETTKRGSEERNAISMGRVATKDDRR